MGALFDLMPGRWLIPTILLLFGLPIGLTVGIGWGVAWVIGILAWMVVILMPELALAILVSGFQLYPIAFKMAGVEATQLSSGIIYVILTSGALIGAMMANPRRAWTRMRQPAVMLFLMMCLYFVVSWLFLTEKTPSAIQKMRYTAIIMVPSFLAALWMDQERFARFAWFVVLFSALGALTATIMRMLGLLPPEVQRLSLSTTSRSLQFAYSVGIGGVFSWVLAREGGWKKWAWATFFGGVTWLMILAAGSRGAFFALVGSLLVFFTVSGQWRRWSMLLLVGSFLAAVLIAPAFVIDTRVTTDRIWGSIARSSSILFTWQASEVEPAKKEAAVEEFVQITTRRTDYYRASWEMLRAHPWLGVGYGGYDYTNDRRQRYLYPHNYFLEVGSETGVIGLVLFGMFLAMALWRAVRLLRHRADTAAWLAASLLMFSLVAGLVSYSFTYHAMLWIGFGLIFSLDT